MKKKKIQQLTPGVVKKLRSGIAFMNVAHCVEELVLNSIDAEANCIAVNLNLPVYQIQVVDNGCGITEEQMDIIGTRYATSKCHTLEDLQNLKSGGFRGEALSSLKEISSVLRIESRAATSNDTYCKIFTQGKALDPKKSLNSRPSKGTTVTVFDFMYNLPVRKKSICEALDVEECRKLLQSIALMYPNISFTLQNEATGELCLQLKKCSSLYHSFLQMFGKSKASNLKAVDYQNDNYEINGCISTDFYISKDLQFLYVNKRHVLRTKLHKLTNRILNKALSSKQKSSSSMSESSSPLKNQCHCIFAINISCPYDRYDIIFEPRKTMIEFSDWDFVLKIVEESLIDFLKRENLYTASASETELNVTNVQENIILPTFDVKDCQLGLFSNVVRRLKVSKPISSFTNEPESQNLEKSDMSETSLREFISKFDNSGEGTSSNELKCPDSRKLFKSSDQDTTINNSLLNKLSVETDRNNSKRASFVTSPLPETDFDIPCRSVFPSENPVMLRVPSKSVLSDLQTGSNNSKFIEMKEKIQCFVSKGHSGSLNKNVFQRKQDKISSNLNLSSDDKSLQCSPILHIHEKKREAKLKEMVDKSAQCPSVSNAYQNTANKSDPSITKETKDKSLQCPSVTSKNHAKVRSRFEFKEESHVLLQNFKKSKKLQRTTARRPRVESTAILNDSFACLLDDDDTFKSKKFKSSHLTEDFDINKVVEKRISDNINTSVKAKTHSEVCKSSHPDVDIESFTDSPRKLHYPNLYHNKVIDFSKLKSSFDLLTFTKVKKHKHPAENVPVFSEFGKSFKFHNEKEHYGSEENFDYFSSENEVNSYQDFVSDVIVNNTVLTPKDTYVENSLVGKNLSSGLKENAGSFAMENVHIDCEESNENNAADSEFKFNFDEVHSVVHDLVLNSVKAVDLPCSPYKNDEILQNKPTDLNFQDEIFSCPNIFRENSFGLHSNEESDALSVFGMKPTSDATSKELFINHLKTSTAVHLEGQFPQTSDGNIDVPSVLSVCNINFESEPFSEEFPTVSENSVMRLNTSLDILHSDANNKAFLSKERSNDIEFNSEPFIEKLSAVCSNDAVKLPSQLPIAESHENANSGTSILEMKSIDDVEFESDPFTEKFPTLPDNFGRLACTKSDESDAIGEPTPVSKINSVNDIEFNISAEKLPLGSKISPMPSEIKLRDIFSDENSSLSSELKLKSTVEIEFESDALSKKLSAMLEEPFLGENCSEENDVNKNVANSSSQELFKVQSSEFEVSINQKHVSDSSAVISPSINENCVWKNSDKCQINNTETAGKTSNEDDNDEVSMYNNFKLHSQPQCKRKVYVDAVTGNSSYIDPGKDEMEQNRMIDGNNGFLKKSHFFLTHDYSPFIPKTPTPDKFFSNNCNVQNDLMSYIENNEKHQYYNKWRACQAELNSNENIENMLTTWNNPAFDIPYEVSSIGDDKITQSVTQMHYFLNSYRFSKNTLNSLQVIGQVDCKFIACILKDFNENCRDQKLLALFDQHAVHERIRLEELTEDLFEVDANDVKCVKTSVVNPPLEISLSDEEIRLLQVYHTKLHKIGIHLGIDNESCVLSVYSVPSCLIHKETGELRRSTSDTITVLQNSITEWLSSVVKTRSISQVLPKTLSSVLNYQACRSAIKFGDPLNWEQCCNLMKALCLCKLPFQCAHGRPSVAPILDLKKIEALYKKKSPPQLQVLRRSFKNS